TLRPTATPSAATDSPPEPAPMTHRSTVTTSLLLAEKSTDTPPPAPLLPFIISLAPPHPRYRNQWRKADNNECGDELRRYECASINDVSALVLVVSRRNTGPVELILGLYDTAEPRAGHRERQRGWHDAKERSDYEGPEWNIE